MLPVPDDVAAAEDYLSEWVVAFRAASAEDDGRGTPKPPTGRHAVSGGYDMELWELLAREGIRDLVARYNAYGDSGLFDRMVALFAPHAEMELHGRVYDGRDAIRDLFTMVPELSSQGGARPPKYIRHCVATHQIDLDDETSATGRCYFFVLSEIGLDHWGRYLDDYRVVEGVWRFARRRVLPDGVSDESVLRTE